MSPDTVVYVVLVLSSAIVFAPHFTFVPFHVLAETLKVIVEDGAQLFDGHTAINGEVRCVDVGVAGTAGVGSLVAGVSTAAKATRVSAGVVVAATDGWQFHDILPVVLQVGQRGKILLRYARAVDSLEEVISSIEAAIE